MITRGCSIGAFKKSNIKTKKEIKMKKLLVTTIFASIMGVSAMAGFFPGATINTVKVRSDGTVAIVVTEAGATTASLFNFATATPEAKKSLIAAILTAKASTGTADIRFSGASITEIGY